ncbi:GNAT family protein [Pedococcus sp.]|uniref:GNAT family N-acetyltransferase n=1 Tax=Pedococcus sp. TaxID=2860345 RepID=UPI002E0F4B8B|nr:GNAT family protein [Pedococcus sp.]
MLPTTVPRLEHPPVLLRPFAAKDQDVVASVASDPLIPLVTTVPASGRAEEVAAYIQRQHDRLGEGAGYSFAIADSTTDEAVGQIGLWTREVHLGRASVGYWVAPAFRRHGYARAALMTLSQWASTLDGIHRLQLFVEPWNEGSWRAAEACGYHREGLLRRWERVGDEYRDMYAYSRLTTEGRPPPG